MKAVVCGAGIAGLTVANRLSALGWSVVVLEKASGPRPQGYMIDFFGAGYDAAEAMGVLPQVVEAGYRIREARLVDDAGRRRARMSFDQFGRSTGHRLVSIMRPDLESVLRESLPGEVELRFATRPAGIDNGADGVRVTLDDGEVMRADLLVGADGIHSSVRRMVFGEERNHLRYLGFHTAAFTFDDPGINAEIGDRFHLTDTIDRQLGLYGLRDGRLAVFAVHRAAEPGLPADPRAALLAEYGSLGWVVPGVLAKCPPVEELYYDQVAQVEVSRWYRGRVVLVGDACAAVSLVAGQGASLGIAGAYVLAEQLRSGAVEAGLERYERLWQPVVAEKQRVARRGIRWFLPHSRAELRLRHAVLALARTPGLDRFVATGLAGKHSTIVRQPHRKTPGGQRAWR
ncbi:FAD-dependent monooxygenase [Saccharopolyspora indica]|uniref:FAD-dependent monooxygenase n=1 Tax=Saccharopolyspora indica TaxID=1229659 RepID=UPI0022EAB58C|nr:FAD-dependent monooxygenase [Saccharopolyspora indica]MDA3649719.1 FAD-dependent monooxygenase [Saccharopolyspora indica]